MLCSWFVISSMPGGAMISTPTGAAESSSSTSLSSSSPSRSRLAEHLTRGRVGSDGLSSANPTARGSGSNASRMRSSAASSARGLTFSICSWRSIFTAASVEIADDRFDVAADVADLGELRRFHFDERRTCQLCKAARDLGFADAGRADHQDVLRRHFVAQRFVQLHAPPAVAQRDGDGALRRLLADDVFIQFVNDLARRHHAHGAASSDSIVRLWFV